MTNLSFKTATYGGFLKLLPHFKSENSLEVALLQQTTDSCQWTVR
jgi:hypothetical protein